MRRAPATAVAILLLAAAGLWSFAAGWHPSDRDYPRQGIDVSHHQGAIDWAALPAQGVDFAYIEATEGGDDRDDRFAANWAGAGRAGIARGGARIDRPLWLRSLVSAPHWSPRAWTLWQASNFRRLRGISGRVDWNVRAQGPNS